MKYYKLINNELVTSPSELTIGGVLVTNPTQEQYLSQGWKPLLVAEQLKKDSYHQIESIYIETNEYIIKKYKLVLIDDIDRAKRIKINELMKYDSSSEVNSFYINGMEIWLDKNDRVSLMYSIESEENILSNTTTVIYTKTKPSIPITLDITMAKTLLQTIEVYAKNSYGVTQTHLNNILNLTTSEDVNNYNFKQGYPNKINLTI
jgi:hypothetical protein